MSKTITTNTQSLTTEKFKEIIAALEKWHNAKIKATAYHQPKDVTPEGAEWQTFESGPRKITITITEQGFQE